MRQQLPEDQSGLEEWKEAVEQQIKLASEQIDQIKSEIANERLQAPKQAFN